MVKIIVDDDPLRLINELRFCAGVFTRKPHNVAVTVSSFIFNL